MVRPLASHSPPLPPNGLVPLQAMVIGCKTTPRPLRPLHHRPCSHPGALASETPLDTGPVRTYHVPMANLTLSIDDELLARGRKYAAARGTSLNALVRKYLEETTAPPDARLEEMIERLRQSKGHSGGVKIERAELHRY